MEDYKTCNKCKQSKTTNNFWKKKSGKFGVSAVCKKCDSEISKVYRLNNKERVAEVNRQWQKNNRDKKRASQRAWEEKNVESEKLRKKLHYEQNKDLWRERNRIWAKENRSKENAKKRNWRSKNPEKVQEEFTRYRTRKKQNGIFSIIKKDMRKLLATSNCFYCHTEMSKPTLDHVIPVSRGGQHSIGNLVASCGSCNSSKGGKTIMEWRKFREWQ
jgi:hypothetical protein